MSKLSVFLVQLAVVYSIIYHMPFAATFELRYMKLAIAGFYVSIIQHRFVIPL